MTKKIVLSSLTFCMGLVLLGGDCNDSPSGGFPKVANGGQCNAVTEPCADGTCVKGICLGDVKQKCDKAGAANFCKPLLYCDGKACQNLILKEKACTVGYQCANGHCNSGTCTDKECSDANPCDAGHYCSDMNKCTAKIAKDGACTAGSQCENGHCNDNICADKECSDTKPCTAGHYCSDKSKCTAQAANGGACSGTDSKACLAGTCTAGICLGAADQACDVAGGANLCADGLYCDAGSGCTKLLAQTDTCSFGYSCESKVCGTADTSSGSAVKTGFSGYTGGNAGICLPQIALGGDCTAADSVTADDAGVCYNPAGKARCGAGKCGIDAGELCPSDGTAICFSNLKATTCQNYEASVYTCRNFVPDWCGVPGETSAAANDAYCASDTFCDTAAPKDGKPGTCAALLADQAVCDRNRQCLSNKCSNGACSALLVSDSACVNDWQCGSGTCTDKKCT